MSLRMLTVLLLLPGICMGFQGKCVGVKDGDSIMVLRGKDSVEIRLYGIDCPEMGQPFSGRAKKFTSNMVFGKTVQVTDVGTDKLGRTLAWVFVNGECVNKELLRAGLAWWYRYFAPNDEELKRLEEEAKRERRGLWQDPNPIPPWNWRR